MKKILLAVELLFSAAVAMADVAVPDYCVIRYHANGGSGSMPSQTVYGRSSVTLLPNAFARSGYVFIGWATWGSDANIRYTDGETFQVFDSCDLYAVWKPYGGTVRLAGARYVNAGQTLELTLTRSGGNGPIAVKYKSQTSTAICGEDFGYVKEIVTWESGDTSSRKIYVPTYLTKHTYRSNLMLRIKLSSLSTGSYNGYSKPTLPENKIYVTLQDNSNAGTIRVTASESVNYRSESEPNYSAPWRVTAGDTLRLTLSRMGGADGNIAVKYKTQTSTGFCGIDFEYVKDVLYWSDGDDSDRTIEVPTYCSTCMDARPAWAWVPFGDLMLRVKLSTLTTGQCEGFLAPMLDPAKIYVTLEE